MICNYCKHQFNGTQCPNCGATYTPPDPAKAESLKFQREQAHRTWLDKWIKVAVGVGLGIMALGGLIVAYIASH